MHPDKCANPKAAEAQAVVSLVRHDCSLSTLSNLLMRCSAWPVRFWADGLPSDQQAYDTLSNPVKKKLYDAYATNETKPDGMSYAEWESRQVEIPRWLERILRIPGGGIWWVLKC